MYRTVTQLDSVMGTLAAFFPQLCTRVELGCRSIQGRPIYALRIHAGGFSNRRGVLVVGGIHAREMMNPDAIVELQLDLVRCYLNGTGLTIGRRRWEALDIKVMLESLDIWMLPCANPDGREYVQTVDSLWRKNRRDNSGTPCDGVDVNRNFGIVWGVTSSATSCNPCNNEYVGSGPGSEPETCNIKWLCDNHRIDVFLDIHSYSELVLYPWGHAPAQVDDSSKRFTTLVTGTCASLNPAGYQEYMSPQDRFRFQRVARNIVADIRAVRGRNYTAKTVYQVYNAATTGTSSDYVYSRHIANPALRKTYGFAFETGPQVESDPEHPSNFHPADPGPIKRDTKAGIISLMLQSICAIEFIGATLAGSSVQRLRSVRDKRLATTAAGRQWIARTERVQTPLLGVVLADKSLTHEATRLFERAQKLIGSEKHIVTARDVKRGLAFLNKLTSRVTSAAVRRDLEAVRTQLQKASGRSMRTILDALLKSERRSPRKRSKRSRRVR